MKAISVFTSLLILGTSGAVYADWSGSKVLNDSERVQVIGDNVYVNLSLNRDFSFLANVPISSAKITPFDSKKVDLSQYGSCPFTPIDLSGYDNATIAHGGKVSTHDRDRQRYATKLVNERNRKSAECLKERANLAKADHEAKELARLQSITLNYLSLQENEINQTNTHIYRVVTTGKDEQVTVYEKEMCLQDCTDTVTTITVGDPVTVGKDKQVTVRKKEMCLQDCTYTVTTITVMFELGSQAYIVSARSPQIHGDFIVIKRSSLDPNQSSYFKHKIIPIK